MTSRQDRIREILSAAFVPSRLEIENESARHASHLKRNGVDGGGETHYHVVLVSEAFRGQSRLARSRAVHAALAAEFTAGLHALSLTLRAPEE